MTRMNQNKDKVNETIDKIEQMGKEFHIEALIRASEKMKQAVKKYERKGVDKYNK